MKSSEARGSQEDEFLVDFLYADRPRIASLSAQLFDAGHLTQTKQTSATGAQLSSTTNGGVPGFVKAGVGGQESSSETIERQFDATWSGPLNLLRELNLREYLVEDLDNALLGQIVLLRGRIQLLDLRMVQKLWRPIMAQESAKMVASTSKANRSVATQQAAETKALVEVVELLPHMLQFSVANVEYSAWGTLDPDQLTINPSDLAFKHGAAIPGEWSVVAVLDAKPSDPQADLIGAIPSADGAVAVGLLQMLNGLREAFGRAPSAFGFTPLVVYRTVGKRANR